MSSSPSGHPGHPGEPSDELAGVRNEVYWLDEPGRPEAAAPLTGSAEADLVVVGGGYTGLWTALLAKERRPERSVMLLEAGRCGDGASGRNGGFVHPSLTHGFDNGLRRWPEEIEELERLGRQNWREMDADIVRLGIDCDWNVAGEMFIASNDGQAAELRAGYEERRRRGVACRLYEADELRMLIDAPSFVTALAEDDVALVHPGRLVWGLRRACLEAGVRIHEGTPVTDLLPEGDAVAVATARGRVVARRVALGTNAFPPLVRGLRSRAVPVYDYVLVTEPLTEEQLARVSWTTEAGLNSGGAAFVYYRLTPDRRILWGGYDAVYFYGGRTGPREEGREQTHRALIDRFRDTFPALADVRFEYRWAGVIDTCTRFAPFFGTAVGGRVAYSLGYTGLGVASSRFGAQVMLDLLEGEQTERTRLRMVGEQPKAFPPEPLRWLGISITRREMQRADRTGRRGLWLKLLDALGLGFDS